MKILETLKLAALILLTIVVVILATTLLFETEAVAETQVPNHSESVEQAATGGRPRMVKPICDFRVLYAKELTYSILQVPRVESGHAWPVEFYAWIVLQVPTETGVCNLPQVVEHWEGAYHYPMVYYDGTSGEIWLRIDLHCPVAAGQYPLKVMGWAWDETAYTPETALWELVLPVEELKSRTVPARYCSGGGV